MRAVILSIALAPACLPDKTESVEREQVLWRNGSPGAWNDNTITGAVRITQGEAGSFETVATVDDLTGGAPSLLLRLKEWRFGAEVGYGYGVRFTLDNAQDGAAFHGGRVELDAALPVGGQAIESFELRVGYGRLTISAQSLSTGFTRIAIPFEQLPGSSLDNVTEPLMIHWKCSYCPGTDNAPVLLVNELRWVVD